VRGRVDTARALGKPHVRLVLRHLRDGRIRASWDATAIRGQQIRLIDRAAGTATVIQRLTTRHRGTVTFRPAGALGISRQIEADIRQDGRPRAQLAAARYRIKLPALPGAVTGLTAHVSGGSLDIAWKKSARASGYVFSVISGHQTLEAVDTRQTSLVVRPAPAGHVTITVRGHDREGRVGRAAVLGFGR